jgi:hypothetical protein
MNHTGMFFPVYNSHAKFHLGGPRARYRPEEDCQIHWLGDPLRHPVRNRAGRTGFGLVRQAVEQRQLFGPQQRQQRDHVQRLLERGDVHRLYGERGVQRLFVQRRVQASRPVHGRQAVPFAGGLLPLTERYRAMPGAGGARSIRVELRLSARWRHAAVAPRGHLGRQRRHRREYLGTAGARSRELDALLGAR